MLLRVQAVKRAFVAEKACVMLPVFVGGSAGGRVSAGEDREKTRRSVMKIGIVSWESVGSCGEIGS